jgi:TonB family protein
MNLTRAIFISTLILMHSAYSTAKESGEVNAGAVDRKIDAATFGIGFLEREFETIRYGASGIKEDLSAPRRPITRRSAIYYNLVPAADMGARPLAKVQVPPRIPFDLYSHGLHGGAVIAAVVGTDGRVTDAKIIEATDASFAAASLEAVSRWAWRSGMKAGSAASAIVVIPFSFRNATPEEDRKRFSTQ